MAVDGRHSAPLLCLRGGAQAQVLPVASCCVSATCSWHLISLSKARQPTTSYLLSTAAWLHTLVCTGALSSHKLQAGLPQGLGGPSFGVDCSRGTADQTLLAEFTRSSAGAGLPPLTESSQLQKGQSTLHSTASPGSESRAAHTWRCVICSPGRKVMISTRSVTRPGMVRGTCRCSKSCTASRCCLSGFVKTSVLPVQARKRTTRSSLPDLCEKAQALWQGHACRAAFPEAGTCVCSEAPTMASSIAT